MPVFLFWLLTCAAAALALASLRGDSSRARYVAGRLAATSSYLPPASVIVPVKGEDDDLRENLAALYRLDYPNYELLVVARSAEDIPPGVLPPRVRVVLAQGSDPFTGEKIQNLAAAIRATRKESEVLAFADSDGRVGPGWLRALAAPLAESGVGASTAYRWYAPAKITVPALLRSAWNAVIAGTFRSGDNRFAWGGATAIRKETFFELKVLDYWKNSVSDDYALSAAVHRAGLRIAWAPGATVACADGIGFAALLEWMRRQLTITRFYAPDLWLPALVAHAVYCAGMAAVAVAAGTGRPDALWLLVPLLLPGMVKAWRRAALAQAALPGRPIDRALHAVLAPAATWLWLFSLAASAAGSAIVWRGNRCRLARPAWLGRE